ncbi:MAG: hypothetical protein ACD_33C00036G0011 [uncultured bacterium]|nr:MAG: hypothetical protein ACD_33C00036G0011 [uncultured bacterium]
MKGLTIWCGIPNISIRIENHVQTIPLFFTNLIECANDNYFNTKIKG